MEKTLDGGAEDLSSTQWVQESYLTLWGFAFLGKAQD